MPGLRISKIIRSLIFLIVVLFLNNKTIAKYSGGTGEPNDPYQIATAEDLIALGNEPNDYDKHFIMAKDIDLAGYVFDKAVIAPDLINLNDANWGFDGTPFTGVFDGNDHAILHMKITGTDYVGLFGTLCGQVKKIGIIDANIIGTDIFIGELAGHNYNGIVTESYSTGSVQGGGYVGGLVGNNEGTITNSYSTVTVNKNHLGGLVGGLVGVNNGDLILCYSTTALVNGFHEIGGLVGENSGSIALSYSNAQVNGIYQIGGLVGANYGGIVTRCYSTNIVNGEQSVGGLVGTNWVNGWVTHCYSTGHVSGNTKVGGLVGAKEADLGNYGRVSDSFWDIQTSDQMNSAGGTGKTTHEMKDANTFKSAAWDFVGESHDGTHEVWQMPEEGGYPVLAAFNGFTPPKLKGKGTSEDPYLISNAIELGTVIYYSSYSHYRLAASIDLSNIRWGAGVFPWFNGSLDGNGHAISHLTIISNGYLGMIERLGTDAKVIDLSIVDVNIVGKDSYYSGGLAGYNMGSIIRCCSTGLVSGSENVGGLVGYCMSNSLVTQCSSTCAVDGNDFVGGLIGQSFYGDIIKCYSNGMVCGNNYVGGLLGQNFYGNTVECYSSGLVNGNSYVGGLIASNLINPVRVSIVDNCFWDAETSGQSYSAGGDSVIGKTTAEMQMRSTFTIAGWDFVGETVNGPNDIWSICEGTNYPRFVWQIPKGDFVCPDGITLEEDFDFFINHWGNSNCDSSNGYCDGTDINLSGKVDIDDFIILINNWLKENP